MLPINLLPPPYDETAFIAGGYAACPGLAEDIDVWCPVDIINVDDPFERVWSERNHIATWLHDHFSTFVEHDGPDSPRQTRPRSWHADHTQLNTTFEGYHLQIPIRRAGVVTLSGASLPYHIIAVGGDVDEVLSSFDITTHAIALTRKGVVKSEHWTSVLDEPRVINQKFTTDARLAKIRARYGR